MVDFGWYLVFVIPVCIGTLLITFYEFTVEALFKPKEKK